MNPTAQQRLRAYELLQRGPGTHREGDGRLNSKHSRMNRSFVRQEVGGVEVLFYPIKFWPAQAGVSIPTLRSWLKKNIITARRLYNMPVMCLAETTALKEVVSRLWKDRTMHAELDTVFCTSVREALQEVRLAIDTFDRLRPLTPRQRDLLSPILPPSTS